MAELEKLVKILRTVVREVVREELSFTKKEILNELQVSQNNFQNITENRATNPTNVFNQFVEPFRNSVDIPLNDIPKIQNHKVGGGGQMSLLQQMAMQKMQNPDDEFLAMKTMS